MFDKTFLSRYVTEQNSLYKHFFRIFSVKAKVPVLTENRNSENVTFGFRYLIEEGKKSKFRLPVF